MNAKRTGDASWFLRPGRHLLYHGDFVAHRRVLYELLRQGRITIDVDWNHGAHPGTMEGFVYVVEPVECSD